MPGVLNSHYNTKGTNPVNLCEACAAGGNDRCERNAKELYYGNSGAFRCLVESKLALDLRMFEEILKVYL